MRVSSADPSDAQNVASETGATAAASNLEAAAGADVVILAVPFDAVEEIVGELGAELNGKTVIDVTNRFAPEQLTGPSYAEQTQQMVPDASVVKAFNTIFAGNQDDPEVDGVQLDGFVAGDDSSAKVQVMDLLGSLGFRPIDTGSLAMARALEAMGTLNIAMNAANGLPWESGWKLVGPIEPTTSS